jgi:hypothetical protein
MKLIQTKKEYLGFMGTRTVKLFQRGEIKLLIIQLDNIEPTFVWDDDSRFAEYMKKFEELA